MMLLCCQVCNTILHEKETNTFTEASQDKCRIMCTTQGCKGTGNRTKGDNDTDRALMAGSGRSHEWAEPGKL